MEIIKVNEMISASGDIMSTVGNPTSNIQFSKYALSFKNKIYISFWRLKILQASL
jgi:hypothetical protein